MIRTSKCYVTADELAETYGISLGQAYKIIHNLNQELKQKGYITLSGKVPRKYLEERIYGYGGGDNECEEGS
jgi:hypothetical protein